jgi:1,2-diacylglycerol 3-alpha-glucosyltransferase
VLNVSFFSDNFYPELGGIQDSIEALARTLARRGHRVECHVPRYSPGDYELARATTPELDLGDNVRVYRHPSLPFPSSTNQSRVVFPSPWRWSRLSNGSRPDLIHTHTFYGVGLEALRAAKSLRIPLVGTNHTAVKAFGPYMPVNIDWVSAYVRWYYGQCDLVTAPSQSALDELDGVQRRRPCSVISNPIETEMFAPARPETRRALKAKLDLSDATVTFAGRLAPEKNIETILRAVAALKETTPPIRLAIAGHGTHEQELRRLAADLRIGPSIRFFGTLDKLRLAELLQASEVFVIMSPTETQSMVMLQAMACGIAVIAADVGALPEYVNNEHGFLVEAMDHMALAEKVALLLGSTELRARLGRAAMCFVASFSTDRIADQWERIYHAVVGEART